MSNIIPMEYNKQRIMTTKVLAEQFGTEDKNIQMNFSRNIDRFIEGKHYYKLEGAELAEFKNMVTDSGDVIPERTARLILWTERGASRHAKILETDEAWAVYEQLEETYFRVHENTQPFNQYAGLPPHLQALAMLTQQAIEVDRKITTVQNEVSNVEARLSKSIEILTDKVERDWKDTINAKINEICARCNFSYQAFRGDLYSELEQSASCNLNTRQKRMRERMEKAGVTYKERHAVTKIHVIESDEKLKQIFEGIVNKYVLKYSD